MNEGESVVVESTVRRKKRGGLDVFQFAETVEPEAWGDRSKDLQVRLRRHQIVLRFRTYWFLGPHFGFGTGTGVEDRDAASP